MKFFNGSALTIAAVPSLADPEGPRLTVVVKGTYRLAHGSKATLVDEPQPPDGDRFEADDPARALRYEMDFAPFKPSADLLLVGSAHAPGGQAVESLDVSFAVDRRGRALRVFGDAEWEGRLPGTRRRGPARPFVRMPIDYEHALGGPDDANNPIGIGREAVEDDRGRTRRPAPNVIDPADVPSGPRASSAPAGFGPIPRTWAQRAGKAGRFARDYKETFWPALPDDFDWSYFNAAPEALRAPYLRGDETIELENLHPAHPRYRCQLPGTRVRCLVADTRHDGAPAASTDAERLREVTMRLDTLWVDADAEELVLVWRGNPLLRSDEASEVRAVYLASESLADPPAEAHAIVAALTAALEEEEEDSEAATEPPEEEAPASSVELDAEIAELQEKLAKAGVPAGVLAHLDGEPDFDTYLEGLNAHFGIDPADADAALAEGRAHMRAQLLEAGGEAEDVAALLAPPAPPEPAAIRTLIEQRFRAGERFTNEDFAALDLSGIDLHGADLSGAILQGTNLGGAQLQGANLEAAQLGKANLAGASLESAQCPFADFTSADLTDADLSGACVDDATLDDVVATGLRAATLSGERSSWSNAELARADFRAARLARADFSLGKLAETCFAEADLAGASLEGAVGPGVDLRGAQAQKLRASESADLRNGRFEGIEAPGSLWNLANLSDASFADANLPGADLSECCLERSDLVAADLAEANLRKSSLREAALRDANLFRGDLEKADLTRCDLRGANLFEAHALDAVVDDTRLQGANLVRCALGERS